MTTLAQLADRLATPPLRNLVAAELVRIAGAAIRSNSTSPERRAWASNVLNDPQGATTQRVMNVLLTNPSVSATLDANGTPTDSDIEYVVTAEVLPLIAPA